MHKREFQQEKRERQEKHLKQFPPVNAKHQIAGPGTSQNTKQDKCPLKLHLSISFSNCRKAEIKKKNHKRSQKGEKHIVYRRAKVRITSKSSRME